MKDKKEIDYSEILAKSWPIRLERKIGWIAQQSLKLKILEQNELFDQLRVKLDRLWLLGILVSQFNLYLRLRDLQESLGREANFLKVNRRMTFNVRATL